MYVIDGFIFILLLNIFFAQAMHFFNDKGQG